MDKIISLLLVHACALTSGYISDTVAPPQETTVNVNIGIQPGYVYTTEEYATFALSDGEKVYEQTVPVSSSRDLLSVSFNVDSYPVGKSFSFTPVSGIESILYNGASYTPGEPITIPTSFTENADGEYLITNTASMNYVPKSSKDVFLYYNDEAISLSAPGTFSGEFVMLPIEKIAELMKLSVTYDSGYNCYILSNKNGRAAFYMDNTYMIISDTAINAPIMPTYINGVAYAPIKYIAEAFGAGLYIGQHDGGFNVYLSYTPPVSTEEAYVNNAGLASDTNYLIWVSKKDFRVHVFTGTKGQWSFVKSLRCSIGAPSTPTCEGTYKYYEPIKKWDYGSYYVGPVMRFNRGYALHSTIVNNNGTLRDGRLEKMISHGCVRIDPPDMNWLFATIPLYTTVHVTA